MLSCLFNAALWSPAGKGLTSSLSCVWCPGSRVELIVSISDLCLLFYLEEIVCSHVALFKT